MLGPGSSCPARAETEGRARTFLPRNDISQLTFPAHRAPRRTVGESGIYASPQPH